MCVYIRPLSGQTGAKCWQRWNVAKSEPGSRFTFTRPRQTELHRDIPALCNVMAVTMQLITITEINSLKTDDVLKKPLKLSHCKHNFNPQIYVEIVCKYVPCNDQTL